MTADRSGFRRAIFLSAVCVATFLSSPAWGFPGPPPTLDELWEKVELVVHARVASAKDVDYGQELVFSALEILKGEHEQGKEISVVIRWGGGCIWPMPLREKIDVLAFLVYDRDEQAFVPWSPWGCIEVDKKAYLQYARVLKQLPEILKLPETDRKQKLLDWYFACAIQPATRVQGCLGLSGRRIKQLTPIQREQLVTALTSETPPGADASSLVSVLAPYPNRLLDEYLLESLKRSHEPGWMDITWAAADCLPERLGIQLEDSTKARFEQLSDLHRRMFEIETKDEVDSELLIREKEQSAILWGALTADVYQQCKRAMDSQR